MTFSILIVLGILLMVGLAATVGRIVLSSRQHLEKQPSEHSIIQPPISSPTYRLLVCTARPSVQFNDDNIPIPTGIILLREGENRWVGVHRPITDAEAQRLIDGQFAIEQSSNQLTPEWVRAYNQSVRLRAGATQDVSRTAREAFQRLQDDTLRGLQQPMQDFQRIMDDFANVVSRAPGTYNMTTTTTRRTRGETRSEASSPSPPAQAVQEAPKPKRPTPKRAIDRLLADDLIDDDDSGVKSES